MRVCYTTAQSACQAVLWSHEQALLCAIGRDDDEALLAHRALGDVCGQRTIYLVDICLQNGALRCGLAFLRHAPPQGIDAPRRGRVRAMRLGCQAANRLPEASFADKHMWAKVSAGAFEYAAGFGFARASVPLMSVCAEVFFLEAFGCLRREYTGQQALTTSPAVQLRWSVAVLRFAQAQSFDAPQALAVLHDLLVAWCQNEGLCKALQENAMAIFSPLHSLACSSDDPTVLSRARLCVRNVRAGLLVPSDAFAELEVQLDARLISAAGAAPTAAQDVWGGASKRLALPAPVFVPPSKAALSLPKRVRFH